VHAANLLAKCLRFNFIDIYNIMSALRKNEALQMSEVFVDAVNFELQWRFKMAKRDVLTLEDPIDEEKMVYAGKIRKYFTLGKTTGRDKL
jgi:hypothetical protein